jgi:hypothetical protein
VNDTIEVEVLEIDGATPSPPSPAPESNPQPSPLPPWATWQGRVRQLDARWWPLWIILGILALGLLLTVGVVLGVVLVIARLVLRFVRGLMRVFSGNHVDTRLSR